MKALSEEKTIITRYAANYRIINAIRQFLKDFPWSSLKQSTYDMWMEERLFEKTVYTAKGGKDMMIEKLPQKKTACQLLLGKSLDKEVQAYTQETRS